MKTRMKLKEVESYTRYAKDCASMLEATYPEVYDKSESKETILHLLRGKNRLFVAEESSRVIAFVGVLHHVFPKAYQIEPLIVEHQFRRQGIGGKLLELTEFKLKQEGIHTLFITAQDTESSTNLSGQDFYADNPLALLANIEYSNHPMRFYEKRGYHITGIIPDANGFGRPEYILSKRILPWDK